MSSDVTEESPLLHSQINTKKVSENTSQIRRSETGNISGSSTPHVAADLIDGGATVTVTRTARRCPVTVEPALLLFSFYSASSRDAFAQYLYSRIKTEKNVTEGTSKNESMFCYINQSDPNFALLEEVQKRTSSLLIYYALALMIPAFVSTVFIGGYSDHGGRKIALICPLIGSLVRLYLSIFVINYDLPIWVFLMAGVLEGFFGSWAMYSLAIFSYISDITTTEQRSFRVVVLVIMFGTGGMLGHYVNGYMIHFLGYIGVHYVDLMVVTTNLLLIFFLVPETIANTSSQRFWTTKHFSRALVVCAAGTTRRVSLGVLLVAMSLACLSLLGRHDVVMLYMMSEPLCWGPIFIGQYKAVFLLISSVGGLVLTKVLQPKIGDLNLMCISFISAAASDVMFAFSKTKVMMFMAPVVGMLSLLPMGMVRAALSKTVDKHETGALFSWVAWIELLGSLLGSLIFNAIYKESFTWFKGFAFLANATLLLMGGILALALMLWKRNRL